MLFTKITDNSECSCLTESYVDLSNTFARRVRKAPDMKEGDFKNHYERDQHPISAECEDICGYHGVSVEIWNDASSSILLEKYQATANYSPKYKNNISVFKFKNDAGVVKYTPNQEVYNEFHYDFFKEDTFIVDRLELVKMIPLIPIKNA